jgi:hypothetical protein
LFWGLQNISVSNNWPSVKIVPCYQPPR